MRVLRHHRAVRAGAAGQDADADAGRDRGALRDRLSRPPRFRRRQFHRQQKGGSGLPAASDRLAKGARLSVRVLDRGVDQYRRRRRVAGADARGEFLYDLRRHREPGHRHAGVDAKKAEHPPVAGRRRPQDLSRRHVRECRVYRRLRQRKGLGRRGDDRLHRGDRDPVLHGRAPLCASDHPAHPSPGAGGPALPARLYDRARRRGRLGRPMHQRPKFRNGAAPSRHPLRLPHDPRPHLRARGVLRAGAQAGADARPARPRQKRQRRPAAPLDLRHPVGRSRLAAPVAVAHRDAPEPGPLAVLQGALRLRPEQSARDRLCRHPRRDLPASRPVLAPHRGNGRPRDRRYRCRPVAAAAPRARRARAGERDGNRLRIRRRARRHRSCIRPPSPPPPAP